MAAQTTSWRLSPRDTFLMMALVVIVTATVAVVLIAHDDFTVPVNLYTLQPGRDTGWRIRCYPKGPSEYGKDHWYAYKNSPEFPGEGNYRHYWGSECDKKTEMGFLERKPTK